MQLRNSTAPKVGEFLLIKNPVTNNFTIGKVNSIKVSNHQRHFRLSKYFLYFAQDKLLLYSAYLLPEEIPRMGERKPHHSKYELIRTDDSCKEFLVNIVKKVNVLRQ